MALFLANFAPFWRIRRVRAALLLSLILFALRVWWSFEPPLPASPLGVIIPFILVIFWLILLVTIVTSAVSFDWRRAVTSAGAMVFSMLLVDYGWIAADDIHLIVMYPHYRAATAGQTVPIYFDWGRTTSGFMPSWPTNRILIYDAGRETAGEATSDMTSSDRTTYLFWHFFINENSRLGD